MAVLGQNAQRLLITHVECAQAGASGIIEADLSWI